MDSPSGDLATAIRPHCSTSTFYTYGFDNRQPGAILLPPPLPILIIHKNKLPQPLQRAIKSLPLISRRKLLHEAHQVRIFSNHEGRNRDIELTTAGSQIKGAANDAPVQAEAVLVVFLALFQTSGLPVGDHENLLVRVAAATEDVHGQLDARYGVSVIGTYL